ncbi:hypothetical protein F443_09754 [Phytophthora nicotianae P1569]|uniref:Uncharacterized protein n=1 Tax=Phytophthora nicotianae P1569 TaxID=1317065 RepID=V9F2M8_PHYNI|nr:hypothetical protein F443_09754 [Phytophthora nicotianae P1569]
MPDESKIPSWHSILQKEVEALGKAILAIRANRAAPIVYGSLPSDTFGFRL